MLNSVVSTDQSNPVINQSILEEWEFPVAMKDLYAYSVISADGPSIIEIPHSMSQALVRTDTNEVMAVHGSKYNPILHSDVVNSIDDAVKKADITKDYTTKIYTFENGKKLKGIVKFPDITVEPVVGDYTCLTIPFWNSYDGSWAFSQSVQGLRLWCLNGQTIADMIAHTRYKHTQNVDLEGAARKITAGVSCFMDHRDIWKSWTHVNVTDVMAEHFFTHTLAKVKSELTGNDTKINKAKLERLMKIWHDNVASLGSNKWALYNTMTYYSTHTGDSRVPHTANKRRESEVYKAIKSMSFENSYLDA